MAVAAPFEAKPHLAAAVSGGADSVACCLLADCWARERGGRVTALTFDHGLRKESAGEAVWVNRLLSSFGIEHVTLTPGQALKSGSALQARAREARYTALTAWCRDHHVPHLLTAHHAGDQAETILMRQARAGGTNGFGHAGMSALLEQSGARLIRPLLSVFPDRIRRWLEDQGFGWIEDPSNQNPRFERVRARRRLAARPDLMAEMAKNAGEAGEKRRRLERETARLAARCLTVHTLGFAWLMADSLARNPISGALLGRLAQTVGGRAYTPRFENVQNLLERVSAPSFQGATLSGARFHKPDARGRVLVTREARNLPAPTPLFVGMRLTWDRRFDVFVPPAMSIRSGSIRPGMMLAAGSERKTGGASFPPASVRGGLPVVMLGGEEIWTPHSGWAPQYRADFSSDPLRIRFQPPNSVSGNGFVVAKLEE